MDQKEVLKRQCACLQSLSLGTITFYKVAQFLAAQKKKKKPLVEVKFHRIRTRIPAAQTLVLDALLGKD